MQLLEAADVKVGNGGQWTLGGGEVDRSCSLEVILSDYCGAEPEDGVIVEPRTESAEPYQVRPFGIIGRFRRSAMCAQPDDEQWLRDQMTAVTEQAVGRALVTQAVWGNDTWIGASQVTEIPAVVDGSDRSLADAVCEARDEWLEYNVGEPLVHVATCALSELVASGTVMMFENGNLLTVWGDKVVTSPGYTTTPPVFLTGPIEIRLSTVDVEQALSARTNRGLIEATRIGMIDMAPCAAVRVGPVPPESHADDKCVGVTITISQGAIPQSQGAQQQAVVTPMKRASLFVNGVDEGTQGTVDWGDGAVTNWMKRAGTPEEPSATHDYAIGDYTVTVDPCGITQPVNVSTGSGLSITGVAPTGNVAHGATLTIDGTGFTATTKSYLNDFGVNVDEMVTTYVSPTRLTAIVPNKPGTVYQNVEVSNDGGTSKTGWLASITVT